MPVNFRNLKDNDWGAIGLWFIALGVFFLPRCIRLGLLGENLSGANLIPCFGCLLFVAAKIRNIRPTHWMVLLLLFVLAYKAEIEAGLAKQSMMTILICNLFIPMILLGVNDFKISSAWIKQYMRLMNVAIYITLIVGIVNMLAGGQIAEAIAKFSNDSFYMTLAKGARMFTWYGHALYGGELFLIFYILNVFYYRRIRNVREPIMYFIVALIGVLAVASKTCTVLLLSLFLLLNIKKMRFAIAGVIAVVVLYYLGVFDLLFSRIDANNLSTGRVESLQYLQERNKDLFPWIIGHGTDYITKLSKSYSMASAGLEFVLLGFAAYFGIIFAVITGLMSFIIPLVKSIRKKDFVMFICVLAIALDVNSYNGLICFQDQMFAFVWVISMLMMISENSTNKVRIIKKTGESKWKDLLLI